MIRSDDKGLEWVGWLDIRGEALAVYARLHPHTKKLDLQSLQVDAKLIKQFESLRKKKWFIDQLTHFQNLEQLPQFLQEALAGEGSGDGDGDDDDGTARARGETVDHIPQILISELDSIGWEHFVSVNQDLNVVKLKTTDALGFNHTFEVFLPPRYPQDPPEISIDLPVNIQLLDSGSVGINEVSSFSHIMTRVQKEINKFGDFFNVLRDLDEHTKILEPSSSTSNFGVVSRRLAVSRTCSIKVSLDPLAPRELCQITYLGPQEEVMVLRKNFGKNMSKWSSDELVRDNLQRVLETTFIAPDTEEDLSYLNECGICYSYELAATGMQGRLERQPAASTSFGRSSENVTLASATPDQICFNRKCGRLFHTACLVSWLQAVPTNKTSFGTLFGNCPYCTESISVRTFQ